MAQHGKPQLHPKVHQAMEWREVHARHDQKGVWEGEPSWAKASSHPILTPASRSRCPEWSSFVVDLAGSSQASLLATLPVPVFEGGMS